MIEINYRLLNPETLDNMLTEIVTRDSTDYGDEQISLADKKQQIHRQLVEGRATIVFSDQEDFCDIVIIESERFQIPSK